jgi:nucleoporin NUP159
MAFGFGNLGSPVDLSSASTPGVALNQGPDLELIQTESLGFLSLSGEAKVRLTSAWAPEPAPTASLLTIASRRGLVATAGPDAVVVGTTEAVRKLFEAGKDGDNDVRQFVPQLKIPLPTRICQIAFTADEDYLILSAEQGGGLAVYDVQALLQGSKEPSFQMPTNGEALRALVPNPKAEKGELCAVVTDKGNLLVANMKERNFLSGSNGQILKTDIVCVAWSKQGKQLVAGSSHGSLHQMTPNGEVKAEIPRPPGLDTDNYSGESFRREDNTRRNPLMRPQYRRCFG